MDGRNRSKESEIAISDQYIWCCASVGMPKNFNNWTYRDVVAILREHSFTLNHTRGSHYYFLGIYGGMPRQVCVPFHGSLALKPRTMKGIIMQSGIPRDRWLGTRQKKTEK